jgi:hypothetical protein
VRRVARTDANHADIVAAFRVCGFSVLSLHQVGGGCPDLLVARAGRSALVEVKDGSQSPSRRKLRASQEDFRAAWRGAVHVVESVSDVARVASASG